jgi:hypothetical protein
VASPKQRMVGGQTGQRDLADNLEQRNWQEKFQHINNHNIFHTIAPTSSSFQRSIF